MNIKSRCKECLREDHRTFYDEHMADINKPTLCSCGEVITKQNMKRHLTSRNHAEKPKTNICEVCNYKTNRAEHLKSHYETYTHKRNLEGKEKKIFNCEECRYSTNDKARYKEHLTSKKHQRLHSNN